MYVAGTIFGTVSLDFGNGVAAKGAWAGGKGEPINSGANALLVMYDHAGNAQWAQTVTAATSKSVFESVKVDAAGHIYASGYLGDGTFLFDPGVMVVGKGSLAYNALLVKY